MQHRHVHLALQVSNKIHQVQVIVYRVGQVRIKTTQVPYLVNRVPLGLRHPYFNKQHHLALLVQLERKLQLRAVHPVKIVKLENMD